jgi:hypothetical protein
MPAELGLEVTRRGGNAARREANSWSGVMLSRSVLWATKARTRRHLRRLDVHDRDLVHPRLAAAIAVCWPTNTQSLPAGSPRADGRFDV